MAWRDVPGPVRVACAILALEALALTALAAFEIVDTVTGRPNNVARALWGAALALIGALALAAGARGLWRLSAAARTPMVVLQVITIPIAWNIAFGAGHYGYGGPLLIAALAVIYLLFSPPARAALDREIIN